jgi:hypothetical protein
VVRAVGARREPGGRRARRLDGVRAATQGPDAALAPVAQAPGARVAQEPARVTLTPAAQDYLYAHQAYSPRNSLQGMAPYVRSVSAEAAPGKP